MPMALVPQTLGEPLLFAKKKQFTPSFVQTEDSSCIVSPESCYNLMHWLCE